MNTSWRFVVLFSLLLDPLLGAQQTCPTLAVCQETLRTRLAQTFQVPRSRLPESKR